MAFGFLEVAVTPAVRALQEELGVAHMWANFKGKREFDRFTEAEAAFIADRDSFYMATTSETGWPYVQHRGGPPGFLKVLDDRTLAFADYRGNFQCISIGNLSASNKACLFLMDYPRRTRLKMYVHADVVALDADPVMTEKVLDGANGRVERIIRLRLQNFDWNCPQHIVPRLTETELAGVLRPIRQRLASLEAENARLHTQLAGKSHNVHRSYGEPDFMSRFDDTSTTDNVLEGVDLAGKRVLVTGVSAGLGIQTTRALSSHGAEVVGTARNLVKAEKAIAAAVSEARNGGSIDLIELDLASLASVRDCADILVADGRAFDVIINNAGVAHPPFGRTVDGFETQFGTNHLGHFVLTNRIAPLLVPGGRLVTVASAAHRFSDIDLEDLNYEHTPYDPFTSYGRSKTACILFGVEFDRRHKERGIRATSVHPGVIRTELSRHVDQAGISAMLENMNAERAAAGKPLFRYKTIPEGAATSVWAGFVSDADKVGGRYCENCHVADIVEGPLDPADEGLYGYAVDPERAKALWQKSEELVGERF